MKLHFHPKANWMNDPNGLCQVNGTYHLFYQYNPHGLEWGDIHWGHAVSRDLYHWEHMPIAMSPDESKRERHCFSGSCCKDRDGKPHFYYTSIGWPEDHREHEHGAEQWMAEPTDDQLTELRQTAAYALKADLHADFTPENWRDPCVVPYGDGWLMVLGGCVGGHGCILLYTSEDMLHWRYHSILAQSETADNVPWECPNMFFADGKAVIFYSPCQAVCYQVGTLDEALHFRCERAGILDPAGREGYYAPQVFKDEQGRIVLFGWMPETDEAQVRQHGWNGCMSMPRLLRIVNGDLYATLADGWQAFCGEPLAVQPNEKHAAENGFVLRMTLTAGQQATIPFVNSELRCITDAERAKLSLGNYAVEAPLENGAAQLTLIVDDGAVECCINGRWLSARACFGKQLTISGTYTEAALYLIQ